MEDRRRYPRVQKSFQVKYHPLLEKSQFSYTIASDVSKGGISMPALSAIAKNGGIVKMDINNCDGKGSICATGKVRWVNPIKRKALLDTKTGIEFIDIAPADVERLVGEYQ